MKISSHCLIFLILILTVHFWNHSGHVFHPTGFVKPLFPFSSSVHLCESDACWHIFGQDRASSISGRCPHACEVIIPNRSKTVGTLFMHCWKVRYSAEVRQQSIATQYSEVMTSSWLSAHGQIQALLCVLLDCSVWKALYKAWDPEEEYP